MNRLFWSVCRRYQEAEEDCTKAIYLDRTYSKAFARRATARVALGKLEEAKQGASKRKTAATAHKKKRVNFNCWP